MLLFEAFAVIHLGDMEARYKELTKYYELTNYIANEREDFSRLLHNDVLQDIGGAKNLLSLRSPDVDETKRILSDLELRVRNMMNFYSSNIFSGYASWEHIGYMLDAIKKLYPKKNILVDFTIDSEARIALKKDNSLEQTMQIIKELVNNVYKHAAATFIHLEIALNEESRFVITCQNDGAKPNDIENILSSKGGMLFLTVLINGNGGNIQYLEKDGILTASPDNRTHVSICSASSGDTRNATILFLHLPLLSIFSPFNFPSFNIQLFCHLCLLTWKQMCISVSDINALMSHSICNC